jgi:type I restriction enzyme S subunit
MSEVPRGWVKAKIGAIARIETGSTPPKKNASHYGRDICFFKPGDLDSGGLLEFSEDMVTTKGAAAGRLLPPDTVLVTCIGNLGKSGIISAPSICNQQINAILPTPVASPWFIYYWTRTIGSWLEENSSATTISIINKGRFSQAPISIPPLTEQHRIVVRLHSLTGRTARAREELGRIPKLIQKYREAILSAGFSGELTRGWRVARALPDARHFNLGSVASECSYGSAAKSSPTGEVPVLRMGNIQDGSLDWRDLVFTSNKDEIAKYDLRGGDVLFNRTNSPALVGKTALYRGERPAIYAGYLIRIRCSPALMPAFLTYCLNSPAGRDYCWRVKTDGVSQSNINAKKLAAFQLPLPTVEEQQEIVRLIETAFAWLDRVAAEHAHASRLLPKLDQAILAKAFRGELVLSDGQPGMLADAVS